MYQIWLCRDIIHIITTSTLLLITVVSTVIRPITDQTANDTIAIITPVLKLSATAWDGYNTLLMRSKNTT